MSTWIKVDNSPLDCGAPAAFDTTLLDGTERRAPAEWLADRHPRVTFHRREGWDRHGKSFDEPITEWEFVKRMCQSTLKPTTDNPTPSGYAVMEDPRWIEFRDAREAARTAILDRDENALPRYVASMRPVAVLFAEHAATAPQMRLHVIASVIKAGVTPLIVFEAFQARAIEVQEVLGQASPVPLTNRQIAEHRDMDYATGYVHTDHWRRVRTQALEVAAGRCQMADEHTGAVHVHHRNYRHLGCEQLADVIVLCGACHRKHHDIPRRSE